MSTLDTLTARNRDFVDQHFTGPLELPSRLGVTIVGCLDPRVDPALVLGLELGDATVIRNIGGRVTAGVLEMLDLVALAFPAQVDPAGAGAKGDLILLHHYRCGIIRMQAHPDQLAASYGIAVADLPGKCVADPHDSLAVDVEVLRRHPGVTERYRVIGMFYDVATGLVETTVHADSAPASPR